MTFVLLLRWFSNENVRVRTSGVSNSRPKKHAGKLFQATVVGATRVHVWAGGPAPNAHGWVGVGGAWRRLNCKPMSNTERNTHADYTRVTPATLEQ